MDHCRIVSINRYMITNPLRFKTDFHLFLSFTEFFQSFILASAGCSFCLPSNFFDLLSFFLLALLSIFFLGAPTTFVDVVWCLKFLVCSTVLLILSISSSGYSAEMQLLSWLTHLEIPNVAFDICCLFMNQDSISSSPFNFGKQAYKIEYDKISVGIPNMPKLFSIEFLQLASLFSFLLSN